MTILLVLLSLLSLFGGILGSAIANAAGWIGFCVLLSAAALNHKLAVLADAVPKRPAPPPMPIPKEAVIDDRPGQQAVFILTIAVVVLAVLVAVVLTLKKFGG